MAGIAVSNSWPGCLAEFLGRRGIPTCQGLHGRPVRSPCNSASFGCLDPWFPRKCACRTALYAQGGPSTYFYFCAAEVSVVAPAVLSVPVLFSK